MKEKLLEILTEITDWISSVISWIISLLPEDPFTKLEPPEEVINILGYVNWFLPIKEMVIILFSWAGALLAYFLISLIMKFLKVVGSS